MAKLLIKVKSVFSRRPKDEEPSPTSDSSSSISRQHHPETEQAPPYHHAAASQPPAYHQYSPSSSPLSSPQAPPQQPQQPAGRGGASDAPPRTFHQQAREIAKMQVGGMRRTVGGGGASSFTASYAPVQPTGPPGHLAPPGTNSSSSYGRRGNYAPGGSAGEKSTFQGNDHGAAARGHHHQQEPAVEDDEDVWARMAM